MWAWAPGVLVALVGIIPGVLVYQQATAKLKQDARQAARDDIREAFDSAKRLYEGGIQEAQRQIDSCNRRIAELEADLEAARGREGGLRRRISRLEDALRRAGLAVPNGTEAL
jgi:chromosome segregation ATPase